MCGGGGWNEGEAFDWRREKTGIFFSLKNSTKSEREPFVCFFISTGVCRWKMRVCQSETSALADVDWQEGAAGMCLAAALCGTGTNRSIIAWGSNRYGQIITWSEGTKSVPNMHSPWEYFFFFRGGVNNRKGMMKRKTDHNQTERMSDTHRMKILRRD